MQPTLLQASFRCLITTSLSNLLSPSHLRFAATMSCLVGCGRCKFSKMPKGDEKATVGCILFLRFCQVITTACLAFAAKSLYQLVRDHKELQSPPYNKHILLAQHIVYATVCLACFLPAELDREIVKPSQLRNRTPVRYNYTS